MCKIDGEGSKNTGLSGQDVSAMVYLFARLKHEGKDKDKDKDDDKDDEKKV